LSNLAKRLLTAAVLIPLLVVGMFLDPTAYGILAGTVFAVFFAGDEYLRMSLPVHEEDRAVGVRATFGLCGAAIVVLGFLFTPARALPPVLTASAILVSISVLLRKAQLPEAGRHMAAVLAGLLYVPMMACVWPLLMQFESGGAWLFLALAVAFGSDSMAYFFGRALGKHKLYEAVSPKKTVQGAMGGLFGGVAAMIGFGSSWLIDTIPISHAIVLGLLGSVLGQLGDLIQSMAKRTFGVKDSGNILPGHGGMLDRVDSLIFVAPMIYYYGVIIADANP
jgi:phosphatidate cytidylyltransferase